MSTKHEQAAEFHRELKRRLGQDPSGLALRVAARFQRRADQPAGARAEVKKNVTPINKPKGIAPVVVKEHVVTETVDGKPQRRDIRPSDVFSPKPRNMNVLDLARSGWPGSARDYQDMDDALRNKVPKDKGYATVNNLSQYLVRTEGGGGTKAVGR